MTLDGIDLDRLQGWLDANDIGSGPIVEPARLAGGTQNVLLRFGRGGRSYVLRRGPAHLRPESNRTMMREARVLRALNGTPVPHPTYVAGTDDTQVLGAAFYVMETVPGFNATHDPPEQMRQSSAIRHRMGLSLIEALASLSRVDPIAVGLADFGKLDGFIQRQVARWAGQLQTYGQFDGWSGPGGLPDVHAVGVWLDGNLPGDFQPGIIHGDYHIGNVIYTPLGEVAAIVDWEMATLGDPLLDLGRVLSTWPDTDGSVPMSMRVEPWDGFPGRDELIAHYAGHTGRDLKDLRWFEILSCYKLAIILEGTYARAQAGKADPATGRRLHDSAVALLRRAARWIESR